MTKPTKDAVSGSQPADTKKPPVLEEYKKAIENSGFLLEVRVAKTLRDNGYLLVPNSPIPHPEEHTKLIEIDVEASSINVIAGVPFSKTSSTLLIECKLNSQPIAFFSHPEDYPEANASRVAYRADPDDDFLLDSMGVEKWHHYARSGTVATQLCSFTRDKQGKITTDPCSTYRESLNQLCQATAARAVRLKGGTRQDHNPAFGFFIELIYPILVAGGPIISVTTDAAGVALSSREHIQLHRGARVGGTLHEFQIDIVTETALPTLLATIQAEAEHLAKWAHQHRLELLPRAAAKRAQASTPSKTTVPKPATKKAAPKDPPR